MHNLINKKVEVKYQYLENGYDSYNYRILNISITSLMLISHYLIQDIDLKTLLGTFSIKNK